ncbi:MAG TPA: AAA family ATPase, partial [Chitinophaga sp.]|uniref:AAA family ATPase n=1 Tax=Chitinophaga sp. TaxID=1869181 RepID=UPI002DC038EB
MNYWHIQLHPNDKNTFSEDIVIGILKEKSVIGLDEWEEGQQSIDQFRNEMQIGDIVVVKNGSSPIALVKVKGDCRFEENVDENFDWFPHRREVEILDFYKQDYNFSIPQARGTLSICRDLTNATSKIIINWHIMYMTNKIKDDSINLLKYKNQIILQGPPGTGKTRLAKIIAEDLIKSRAVGDPESIIDDIVKKFDPNEEGIKISRENNEKLLNTFYELFPKDSLDGLTLESYCAGKGDRDNFCWWIERGLKPLGYYFPGSARAYLIFWKKELEDYSKHGFIKDIEDNNEAMKKVADLLYEVVQTKKTDTAVAYFGAGFLLKLLNSYYPDEYFPINSERMIDNALKIFREDFQGLDVFEKNKKLNEIFLNRKRQFNSSINSFEFARVLFEKFNIKTGENVDVKNGIVANGEYDVIQFHPGYSYEDFVRGIVAKTTEEGIISYQVENKILADFAQKAVDDPNGNYVLIIDEINRANLPSVLGELIYALEYRSQFVTSMYEYKGEREIMLPKNLFLIGTMNTADRSVGHIDYAIRRRFAFIDVLPDENV